MVKIFNSAEYCLKNKTDLMGVRITKSHGSTPRSAGAVMLVKDSGDSFGTIGGGALEKYCIKKAVEDFGNNFEKSFSLSPNGGGEVAMVCGGDVDVEFRFFDSCKYNKKDLLDFFGGSVSSGRVVIFGAGHVAFECARVLDYLDFDTAVYDPRPEFANKDRYKTSDVICAPFEEIELHIDIKDDDYVIVMTHGHANDANVLLQVLQKKCKYIGCIGSKNKIKVVNDFLKKNKISDEKIAKIHSPIGLEIYAQTPEEIAISVAAEIILERNKK